MNVKSVGIAGSGVMGGGIAEVAARSGFEVVLRSRAQSTADAALGRMVKSLAKQVEKGKLSSEESEATVERVRVTGDLGELEPCDNTDPSRPSAAWTSRSRRASWSRSWEPTVPGSPR